MNRKQMSTILLLVLTVITLLMSLPLAAKEYAKADELTSPHIAVYNAQNGRLVFSEDAETRIAPGSTAKIMTGILATEHFAGRMDTTVTVTSAALRGLEGSAVLGLKAGEEIPVRDLLYALLVAGANDAANVLAIEVAGSILDFVSLMNAKAKELDAVDTLYLNATGLDSSAAYTTAADTAKIAAYASANAEFMKMCSARAYTVAATNKNEAVTVYTKNMLLSAQSTYFYGNAKGMSAGYTEKAGMCVVTAVTHGAYPYIGVVMGAEKDSTGKTAAYTDVKKLLEWANGNFANRKILDSSKIICELPVRAGRESDHVLIVPDNAVYAFLDRDADLSAVTLIPELNAEALTAPVEKGKVVGSILIVLDGEPIGSTLLVTKTSVRRSAGSAFFMKLGAFFRSKAFWIPFTLVIIAAILFASVKFWILFKKAKQKSSHNFDRKIK